MGGILECRKNFIQARKPFTEFISLNRKGEEDYAQCKDILKQYAYLTFFSFIFYCLNP